MSKKNEQYFSFSVGKLQFFKLKSPKGAFVSVGLVDVVYQVDSCLMMVLFYAFTGFCLKLLPILVVEGLLSSSLTIKRC
jgi:hypothetical protein